MSFSFAFTVNNVGNDEQVVAQSVCTRIVVGESEGITNFPTVDWEWKGTSGSDYMRKTKGSKMVFETPRGIFFRPGDLVASIRTVAGSSTFAQEEY